VRLQFGQRFIRRSYVRIRSASLMVALSSEQEGSDCLAQIMPFAGAAASLLF